MRRTITRAFRPYTIGEGLRLQTALDGGNELKDPEEPIYVDEREFRGGFRPRFRLFVDRARIAEEVGVEFKEIQVKVIHKDVEGRRFWVIKDCGSGEHPRYDWVHEGEALASGGREFEIAAIAYLKDDVAGAVGRPTRKGQRLATSTVTVRKETDNISFPVVPKSPEEFAAEGLPSNTVYFVKFKDYANGDPVNVDRPVEVVLEVWINRNCRKKLDSYLATQRAGAVLGSVMSAEIVGEIAYGAFRRATVEPLEEGSLLTDLVEKFGKPVDFDFFDLQDAAGKGNRSLFSALGQSWYNLDKCLS